MFGSHSLSGFIIYHAVYFFHHFRILCRLHHKENKRGKRAVLLSCFCSVHNKNETNQRR
jgi:hypothetical protein